MTLAVLTKSAAALMILPGIFIYTLIKKKLLFLLKSKDFYIGIFIFLLLVGGYYGLRELYNPGYLMAVWENEFGGRFLETIEGHKHGFWYYYENMIGDNGGRADNRFTTWMLLIPCGIIAGILSKDPRIKNLTIFSTIMAVTYFLVISFAQTKLHWYDLPLYPFLAILVGVFLHFIFSFLKEEKRMLHYLKYNITPYIFVFLVFIMPYSDIVSKTHMQKEYWWDVEEYRINYYLRDILKGKRSGDNFTIPYDGYAAHVRFYVKLLNDKGKNISVKKRENVVVGETVLFSQREVREFLEENFEYNILEEFYNVRIYEIIAEK